MSFDTLPIWVVLLATVGMVELALEVGVLEGKRRHLRGGVKSDVSSAMVAATMSLLSFMLAFTFNSAAGRHDVRKGLVIEETNAINKTWLRAGILAEPYRTDLRRLLRDYVEVRVKAAASNADIAETTRESEALHARMWTLAEEAGKKDSGSITGGLLIQALNEVIDLHLRRLTVGIRNRVPAALWVTLYLLLALGMMMMGILGGLSGTRQRGMELALALSFSLVLFLIADLDRPQEGFINVSQQAMQELQIRLNAR